MYTFEDNKLLIAHLLNLPFQEIDTISTIDSSSISCVLKNTHSACPFCHSTHVYRKVSTKNLLPFLTNTLILKTSFLILNVLNAKNVSILSLTVRD
ncbi:hypothetical protein JDW15_10100 [Aerococcaceae bacterium zg-ZJ1578]|uniref:hypothetical protein n=1 Tax=Aerococcaceae bacterium zg-252 TaxID=2796928 RepID=UPI001A3543E5|nr:hypothetical protein [Aerococcaceae bacterium zg-1578]